jgi:TonB-linked SusC/RagA family outer membrane protein
MAKLIYLIGNRKQFLYLILFLVTLGSRAFPVIAQDHITLRGKVVDRRSKETIIGANVLFKNAPSSQTGAVTDIDGLFNLKVTSIPATIVVSYIGYRPQEIDIYEVSPETLVISLIEDLNVLNEIVVIGYGTQKRSEISGSVASVPSANLSQASTVSSFDNLLGGTVAGVNVVQSSGQPGASSSIRIRGGNSINGGNEPLYVIDGFIMYNDNTNVETGVARSGAALNALSTINPTDIESIDILKDASATAIYGSRGANGVILITTKKGKKGSDLLTYSASFGWSQVTKKLDLLNAKDWARLRNDVSTSIGATPDFTPDDIEALGDGADWQSASLQTGVTQNHLISITGGDDKTQYAVSGNYYDQEGILSNTQFQRYTVRSNLNRIINPKLRFGINMVLTSANQTGVGIINGTTSPNTFSSILLTPPVATIYNDDGSYNFDNLYLATTAGGRNPIADLKETTNETKVKRSLGNFYAEYKLLPELTAKLSAGADLIHTKQNYYSPIFTEVGQLVNGSASIGSRTVNSWQSEFTLTYDKTFNENHAVRILGGYTTQRSDSEGVTATATNFVNDIVGFNSLGSGLGGDPSSSAVTSVLNSWLGRVNYSYLKRYNLSVSFRTDGSSRFLSVNNKQWSYFPSVGFSWNANEENFLKNLQKLFSNLKIRLSAGTTGNQEIGDYRAFSLQSPLNYSFNRQMVIGYVPSNMANPDLKWEETTQYNAGIDLGVSDERITLNFDAYYKKTNDLLVDAPVETVFGHQSILRNIGSVSNKGFELQINADVIRSKGKTFNWKTSFVLAHNVNEVLSLGDNVDKFYPAVPSVTLRLLDPIIVQVGQPLGTFWGYKTDGIVQSGDDLSQIAKPSWINGSVQHGDRKYVNVKNDDNVINADDRVLLGSSQPKFNLGFTNVFGYKGFDLLAVIQGSYGGKIYNALKQQLEITTLYSNTLASVLDRWTPSNPSNEVPRATSSPSAVVIDKNIEDGSFIRLKNLTLGYKLPANILTQAKIKKARVFLTGQNLFTLTRYSGYDPEVNSYEQNNLLQGIDYGAYPASKTFLIGVELSF